MHEGPGEDPRTPFARSRPRGALEEASRASLGLLTTVDPAAGPGSRGPGPRSNEVAGPAEALLDPDRYREEVHARILLHNAPIHARARAHTYTIVAKSSL